MKYRLLYLAMAVCATLATSCSDDELPGDNNGTNDANAIQFGVTSTVVEARTVYGDPGTSVNWPLYWKANDQIHIYCPDAEDDKFAAYIVSPEGEQTHKGKISPLDANVYLKWSGDSNPHDFYAAYPYGKATAVELAEDKSTAYITFAINNNQTCTINTTPSDGNFVAEPDMTNAYMVAHNLDVKPSVDAVSLDFKPIMTTLVVKVTAPEWALNTTGHATITGISVITEVDSEDANKGQFVYDVVNKSIVSNPTGNKTSHSTFVGVKHGENNFIDLGSNQTLTMTVFLPPIPINNNNPVQVKLHVAGSDFVAHLGEATPETKPTNHIYANVTIEPSQIRRVNLPTLPDPLPTTSAWLTPLDDDIYVSQLSIPGTHDAATSSLDASLLKVGKTQALTIKQQLEMGIRVFDLRPMLKGNAINITIPIVGTIGVLNSVTGLDNIYHGTKDTGVSMADVFTAFDNYLKENEKEFVIVILRNETTDKYYNSIVGDQYASIITNGYKTQMSNFLVNNEVYQKRKIEFTPDLTIGDMRNGCGRILILSRDEYADYPNGGAFIQWSHSWPGIDNLTMKGTVTSNESSVAQAYNNTLTVQDVFSPDEDKHSGLDYNVAKPLGVIRMMENMITIQKSNSTYWMINHCSGYDGANNYPQNSQDTNLPVYNYLMGKTVTLGNETITRKENGSTGIVMLDFVGARTTSYIGSTYTVNGDLLPQTIIDNNYKYIMKRKTN